jgi:predicted PilT family ATPase
MADLPGGHGLETLKVPKTSIGHIVGKKGTKLKLLRTKYGIKATFEKYPRNFLEELMHVYGPRADVKDASKDIQHKKYRKEEADAETKETGSRRTGSWRAGFP